MAISISNAFDILNLLEENQHVVKDGYEFVDDNERTGYTEADHKDRDGFDANVDIVNVPSCDDDQWQIQKAKKKLSKRVEFAREGQNNRAIVVGGQIGEQRESDDVEAIEFSDWNEIDDEWHGYDETRVYNDYMCLDSKDLINQPDNLPIEEDELDKSSGEFDQYSFYCSTCDWHNDIDWHYTEDSYSSELEIEENDIYVPYEARKLLGKQRLKRMSGKKTGTTKLMKLKKMDTCCCNCTKCINY